MDDALENLEEYLKLMREYKDLGISPEDILRGTRKALEEKKKTDIIAQQIAQGKENSVTKNQTMVFDHTTDCKIFQDGRNTKIKTWSVRIWDRKRKKPIIRSLKTVDKATALTLARDMYMTFTTRGAVYLSTDSITTKELVALYIQKRRGEVSPNPQEGITARSLNVIETRLKHWMDYIDEKGYSKANIENIPPELGLDFAIWIKNRKITTGKKLGERKNRSNTTINQIVGAAKRMYHKVGIDGGYITANELPKFTTLKKSRNQCSNKDVLQHSEMSLLYKWMREKYAVETLIPTLFQSSELW